MTLISRRKLLQSSGSALVCLLTQGALWAKSSIPIKFLKVNLAKEFPQKQILDVSADGMKLCFENWSKAGHPMEVVEVGTWKMIFTGSFQTRVGRASFFGNSKALLAESLIKYNNKIVRHLTVVDLLNSEHAEGQNFPNNPYEDDSAVALSDQILLIEDINWKSIERCFLVLVEFPTYREIAKVPFVIGQSESEQSSPGNSRTGLSVDRSIFVYSYGRTLVCRQTKDLNILWTRKIEPPISARKIVSPNGSFVAVAIADSGFRNKQKESYIDIYNGKTGAVITRLPLCGTDGLALSPDGSLLAVADLQRDTNESEWVSTVHIYDTSSGKRLTSIVHDRLKSKEVRTIYAGCTVHFTSDGQYLVTSGINSKIWKIDISSPE
jgi:WD40 repeat protein